MNSAIHRYALPKASVVTDVVRILERQLATILSALAAEQSPFPVRVALPDPPAAMDPSQAQVHLAACREVAAPGVVLEWEARATRKLGTQTWPVAVRIDDLAALARLLSLPSLAHFSALTRSVLTRLPGLRVWWQAHPLEAWQERGSWRHLVHALRWLVDHYPCALHSRAIPWSLHGKFVEEHRRLLDILLRQLLPTPAEASGFEARWGLASHPALVRVRHDRGVWVEPPLPASDLAMALDDWLRLPVPPRALVLENLATFLAVPLRQFPTAIWGQGFAVVALAPWLAKIPDLAYWGDLDAQGFEILDRLRAVCPQVRAVGMDRATWDRHAALVSAGTPATPKELPHLTRSEWDLYRHLVDHRLRLEQEKLPMDWVVALAE